MSQKKAADEKKEIIAKKQYYVLHSTVFCFIFAADFNLKQEKVRNLNSEL